MATTTKGYDTFSLSMSMSIVDREIFTEDANKEMVIDPFGNRANAMRS